MLRLFKRHKKRKATILDGIWKFKTDPDRMGVKEAWFKQFPDDCAQTYVPSCWNNDFGYFHYEGVAWYSVTFETTKRNINLIFNGVTGQADVYLDGKHLGGHYGGYTSFNFVVNNIMPGTHDLAVCVDNSHNDIDSLPLSKVDWFHYGGIPRSVEVMELDDVWIKDSRIEYKLDENFHSATLKVAAVLEGFDNKGYQRELKLYVNDHLVAAANMQIKDTTYYIFKEIILKDIKLWDTKHPNLYTIRLEIEEDDLCERVGFRHIKMEERKIFLNGRRIFLKGVNRHEDHPDWGSAMHPKLLKRDMDIIRDMGCNAIRGAHYPNHPMFLDYCDEEGILFWEEIPIWQHSDKHMQNPLLVQRGLKMLEEMVTRDYHHPSIIMWGMHNEIDTTNPLAYEMTRQYADKIKGLDSTRAITYASSKRQADICFNLADMICINYYIGWYTQMGELNAWTAFLKDMKSVLKKQNLDRLPLIISEFGAEGLLGTCSFEEQKWSENYQNKYLEYTLNLFCNDPDISGVFIWQFSDVRSSKNKEMMRARGLNNKGIVDEYRRPKLAYWTVKRIFNSMP